MIYLDSAATTFQKPAAVQRAVVRAMRTMSSPGRGGYAAAPVSYTHLTLPTKLEV